MKIQNQGFDHVEFSVDDIQSHRRIYERMGFECVGERHLPKSGTRSLLMQQGEVRILFTQPDGSPASDNDLAVQFRRKQDQGICVLAVDVEDAEQAYLETTKKGARPAREPEHFETAEGSVTRAEIYTPGNVRYRFISRKSTQGPDAPALFDEGLKVSRLKSPSPFGMYRIDHLTNNVTMGDLKVWVDYYKDIFGFIVTRHFLIKTGRTGLNSDVVQSADHKIKVPINEATEPESQVQEFVNRMKGSGVQHLALETTGLMDSLVKLRKNDFKFLTVPHTYYEVVPTRVPGVTEDLAELERLGILLDGEGGGYLMQIFSEEILGPFFFEFIQRKGNQGFGEGNFRALFEAIERDQVKRGVL
jgi:4-hydroxyphenylpyruvate dioxygenase